MFTMYSRADKNNGDDFFTKEGLIKRTALLAVLEGEIVGKFEYRITNMTHGEIVNFEFDDMEDGSDIFEGFVDEMMYWSPYLRQLKFDPNQAYYDEDVFTMLNYDCANNVIDVDMNIELKKMKVSDITPEQLTVDEDKLKDVLSWVERPEQVIVTCIELSGKTVCIDGYSRLLAAYQKGFEEIYVYIDKTEDTDLYSTCLSWCVEAGVLTIEDLSNRVVDSSTHKTLWIDRCQNYLNEK